MGLRDVTGVFSRFFVVGFFVPSFFVVLTLATLFVEVDGAKEIYVAGGVALLMALVLVGLRDAVWQAFERYPWRSSPFGDATFEYHERVEKKWGLTVYWAWPFVKPFFNEYERELDVDGRSDVHFFLNSCLGAVAIAVGLVVDTFDSPIGGHVLLSLVLVPLAFAAAIASYLGAVSAVRPWGEFKEAAVVLHRFDLYAGIGFERPRNRDEDRDIAGKVNDRLAPLTGINEQAPIVADRQIEIAAAPEAVWNVMTAFGRWRRWNPEVKSVSVRGAIAERSEFRLKEAMERMRSTTERVKRPRLIAWMWQRFGIRTMRSTIERVERPRLIAWRGRRFGIRAIYLCRLEPRDGKTLVRIEASYEGLIPPPLRASLRSRVDRALTTGLQYLKDETEEA